MDDELTNEQIFKRQCMDLARETIRKREERKARGEDDPAHDPLPGEGFEEYMVRVHPESAKFFQNGVPFEEFTDDDEAWEKFWEEF